MMAGQTINDRFLAAKHSIAGQGLAKAVCKATTEEMIGPKKKHLDYLVHCTNEPNVSIPQLANLLIERSQNTNWVVVYKALITVHHMMCYGNERFTQYLASSNSTFQLSNFLDKSGLQGVVTARTGYDMSPFIRRYSKYLNEKALSYRVVAFDFCKVKRGKEDGALRTMNTEKLLKTLPTLQNQLDGLLEFDCTANDLTNGVINMCFMLLFRDLIRLFACYNDGIINLIEKYFDMNKKQCREALDLYKRFLVRMDRVAEFLKVAENVGIDKGDIPDLTKAPSSLLDAFELHLSVLEGKKGSSGSTPVQSASNQKSLKSGVSALSSTSSSFGLANGKLDMQANGIDESLKQQVLAEEEAVLNQFKSKVQSPAPNPFLDAAPRSTADLFTVPSESQQPLKSSDDLLQLGNPFMEGFLDRAQPVVAQPLHSPQNNSMWMTNGNGYSPQANSAAPFVSENNFQTVFGNTTPDTSTAAEEIDVERIALNPFLLSDISPLPDATEEDSVLTLFGDLDDPSATPPLTDLDTPSEPLGVPNCCPKDDFDDEDGGDTNCANCNTNTYDEDVPDDFDTTTDFNHKTDGLAISPEPMILFRRTPPPRPPPPKLPSLISTTCPESTTAEGDEPPKVVALEKNGLPTIAAPGFDAFGVLQPANAQNNSSAQSTNSKPTDPQGTLLTGDLESSLASLANNLSINTRPAPKGIQWNSPKNGSKGSGSSWSPQPMSATTGAGYRPMGQGMASVPPQPMFTPMPSIGMRPLVGATPVFPPRMGMQVSPNNVPPMAQQQQSLLFH